MAHDTAPHSMTRSIGVIVANTGSPASPAPDDIEAYLGAYLMDPPALADVILRCVSQAQDEVAEEVSQIASRTWGEDSQLTHQIVRAVSVRPADAARERENYRRSPRRERLGMFDPDGIIRLRR